MFFATIIFIWLSTFYIHRKMWYCFYSYLLTHKINAEPNVQFLHSMEIL